MLRISESIKGDLAIVAISGVMINADAIALNEKVKNLVHRDFKKIILDLGETKLMNSCFGLGIITACWAYVNRFEGKLTLANPNAKVAQLLKMTKLDQVLEVADTLKQAEAAFHS